MPQFAIKDIQPNPFRHIERYTIRRDKVDALRESLRKTGFWDNVVARMSNGKPEIAYGHHRLTALKEEFKPDDKVNLIIRDLSNEMMLQIMARENMEEWGTNASVEHETVRAVVEAYAEGKIELPKISLEAKKEHIRYAPSFTPGKLDDFFVQKNRTYNGQTIAEFLGWLKPNGVAQNKIYSTLTALQFIEEGILKESDFEGLTTMQAEAVVQQARKAKAKREKAAKLAAQQAEQARKEAEEAEQRRQEAEAKVVKAREEDERRKAEEEAKRAEEELRAAKRRVAAETQKQKEEQKKGKQESARVGKGVSEALRTGKKGYREADEVAAELQEKTEGPPTDLNKIAQKLATELHSILDPNKDEKRVAKLKACIQYKDSLRRDIRIDLIKTLYLLASRATDFAQRLDGTEYQKLMEGGK